ncbi:LysR family transcriptional regulator [Marinimicrobium sp. ABcell2]|uniref:LysR family transcriptional regulator n=1 Tax=Marinimicrobium sp. ABcell2 TaxID=3069751 RepID=UPI0027B32C34|nr:LysR family transcriptional regulator [Marinimicrobium sp. ABcell2]MDQ2078363.1 LysR family transcriptional regulator [Marinimicrobium sp. ABcell2]
MEPKVSLEQWRALLAVIDAGSYAKAAEQLGKSQSAVSYAIQQLETALGVAVFELQGRRAVPTAPGELLYRRARHLLAEAERLESAACRLSEQVEPLVGLAGDVLIPPEKILAGLAEFADAFPETRVEFYESVMSGTDDALVQRRVDLAVAARVPPGFVGDYLMPVTFYGVTSPQHPLQHLGRPVTFEDLRHHRQMIVRDSGMHRRHSEGWQEAEQRWTVSHIKTSLAAVRMGLSYAWLPEAYLREALANNELKLLPMEAGAERVYSLYLIFADRDLAGPATRHLAEVLRRHLSERAPQA